MTIQEAVEICKARWPGPLKFEFSFWARPPEGFQTAMWWIWDGEHGSGYCPAIDEAVAAFCALHPVTHASPNIAEGVAALQELSDYVED